MENSTATNRKKRDAAYYREYRRKKKAEADAKAASELDAFDAGRAVDITDALEWIEATLKVPSGPLTGEPFRLPQWEKDWLIAAYQEGIREAGLSIARKNGKSGLIAAAFLAHLVGPLARPQWRGLVASLTGLLARELRDATIATAAASGLDKRITLSKSPPPGRITGKYGSRVDFLAADKSTGHAVGADLAVIDEAGLLPESRRPLWNALFSSISGRDGRFWAISIQGDGPLFQELEERAESPGVHFRKWSAPLDCELDDESAWRAANPGIADGIKSLGYMKHQAERAKASPGNESHFRAYDLNQPVDPEKESIVSVGEYAACITQSAPPVSGDIVVGIDLGSTLSMTCAVALAVDTGAILLRGAFGDEPTLSQRAKQDRMGTLYDRMLRDGELKLYPGRLTPVIPFLIDFFEEVSPLGNIVSLGADRHRRAECEHAFREANIPFHRMQWRGQGASKSADGSHDVRAFQRYVRSKTMATTGSVMLEAAIASSVLRFDGAGNPALDKRTNNARIDALSAAVIAAGLRELVPAAPLMNVSVV